MSISMTASRRPEGAAEVAVQPAEVLQYLAEEPPFDQHRLAVPAGAGDNVDQLDVLGPEDPARPHVELEVPFLGQADPELPEQDGFRGVGIGVAAGALLVEHSVGGTEPGVETTPTIGVH